MSDHLKRSAQAVMAAALRSSDDHPSPDELIDYHTGGLSEASRDLVRRHLTICPECAGAVLDLAAFPAVEPREPEDRLTSGDVARNWLKLSENLPRDTAPTITKQSHSRLISWFASPRLAWAMAGIFMLTSLSLAWPLISSRPVGDRRAQPRMNLALAELPPENEADLRTTGEAVLVPASADSILLILVLAEPARYPEYEVDVRTAGPEGEVLWRSSALRRLPEGHFTLELPRGFLPPGRYEVEIRGREDGQSVHVATYGVHLVYE